MVSFDPYTAQQDCAMPTIASKPNSKPAPASELDQSTITSYEQGWDRWDGPIWPLGTEQCELQSIAPAAAMTSYEEGWDRWDGPVWPKGTEQCELQKVGAEARLTSYEEGWDRWDGPVWSKGTEQCELQNTSFTAAITSYEEGWDRWDGPVWKKGTEQCELQSTKPLSHEDQSLPLILDEPAAEKKKKILPSHSYLLYES